MPNMLNASFGQNRQFQVALRITIEGLELPFYMTSWPILRPFLSCAFVVEFEKRYSLDPNIETAY